MKNTLKSLVIAALFSAVLPAQAAIVNYNFDGAIESGEYAGRGFTGNFSFDDAGLTNSDTEFFNLTSASMTFLSTTFNETNFTFDAPAAVFKNGVFSGLDWSFDSTTPNVGFSFIAGSIDDSDAYVAYDTSSGSALSGTGSVNYSAVAAVPEAETYAMFLAGLGLMGFVARRKRA